ncbi:MAG: hypothetical protein LBK94_02405 [Prevotellaceae bacterium]|jgi:hypothetical protein|nr:hypothetical protein [Prevotellaceae bacterium]
MSNEDKNIELRSEKVRNITGKIPPVLVRYGITVVATVLLALFAISIIIPYRETINLSVTIHGEPDAGLIKSPVDGKVIIDTNVNDRENTAIAYIQSKNKIYPVYADKTGSIVFSVKNGQFVEKDDVIFIIISDDNYELYGIADITDKDDANKIKTGQIVNINIYSDKTIQGIVSDIYAVNSGKTEYRLKISIAETDYIYLNSKYKGTVVVAEKTVFRKIFK